MKTELNQVQMAPFGLTIDRGESYGVWEGSGMPPGPQNRQKRKKTSGFRVFTYFSLFFHIFPYFPIVAERCRAAPTVLYTLVAYCPSSASPFFPPKIAFLSPFFPSGEGPGNRPVIHR